MYAFVRECTRLAPLMATHCVISTSGRVTPRYKTNDKARQIPLRFESLKSSLVLPLSRFCVSPTLFLSLCLSCTLFSFSHIPSLSLSLSLFLSFSLSASSSRSFLLFPLSVSCRVTLSLFVPLLRALPLLAGLCLLPFTVSSLPRIEDTGVCTYTRL